MRDQPAHYGYPRHIVPIIEKAGRNWNREEYSSIVAWLFEETQLRKLLTLCLFSLGSMATAQDAEDAWMEFCEKRLEKVSKLFDPERGSGFWGYLCLCLKRESGHFRQPIEKMAQKELALEETYQTTNGEVELELASTSDPVPGDQWEFNRLLQELLSQLPPPYREAFILIKLEDRNYEEAAVLLGISPGLARIRVHRAIEKLRNHRQLKQYLDITTEVEEE